MRKGGRSLSGGRPPLLSPIFRFCRRFSVIAAYPVTVKFAFSAALPGTYPPGQIIAFSASELFRLPASLF